MNGHIYHQLLWSYLDGTVRQLFAILVLLYITNREPVKVSAAANSFIAVGTPAVSVCADSLVSKMKCNLTWHVF